ncbi:putative vancomycin resistance protein [Desulfitobacterium dehalogenans ATCC 51507]|uniref:Putative vancomycin resistance protein n=1 Tax=Desulfitobacterium dehalogenans (strain ATCC 51507 / DSM 9161 / JW/IU-DC1) TaxID=756499 RepID=I4A571_DESDJ|nr:cell wall-binding repeat-containing protein [Desulfitobacterium dehalogenans]AFL99105.1 putative vancomycin resistance protein [Desulfitobacterium dehalogenans ATCC 51507]
MKKRKKLAAIVFFFYCISVNSPVLASTDTMPGNFSELATNRQISQYRLYGETRYETAKIISEYYRRKINLENNRHPSEDSQEKVKNVVIATGNGYADALSASVMAHEMKAPIILVDTKIETSEDAFDYVGQNLDPQGTLYIIGGESIIGREFERKFIDLGFSNMVRISGGDRYDTSYKIAGTLKESDDSTVVISSGEQYADALSISSFAANQSWPILLSPPAELPQKIKEFLQEKRPGKVYITGGTGAISDRVLSEIRQLLPQVSVERLIGQSRFDTNMVIAKTFAPNPSTLYLTTGHNFADALAGSVVAAQMGDPIVFIDPSAPTLPKATAHYLEDLSRNEMKPDLISFGGKGAVPDAILKSAADLLSGSVRAIDIHSIPEIEATVVQGKEYSLPATVRAYLYNGDGVNLTVRWNETVIDTRTMGLKVLEGRVEGYEKPVKLSLTVSEPLPLAEFSTRFNVNEVNRTENIRLATEAINGTRIAPGEIFSFNETVGERTIAAGYKEAVVIEGNSFIPGIGGGICQVSSTLFNATNLAHLEIVERHHHSLPVGYVPPGQDATVFYSVLDFKFKNTTKEDIILRTLVEGGTLTIKIY